VSVAGTFIFVFQADTSDLDKAFEGIDHGAEAASKNTKDVKEDMRGVRAETDKTTKASKKYQKTQKETGKAAEQSARSILGAMQKLIGVAGGILAGGALGGMFGENFFNLRALQTFSEILGQNAQEIDTWTRSVQLAGGTSADFSSSLTSLVQGMNQARMGDTAMFEAFARMGVSLEDAEGTLRDPFDTLMALSDRLSQFSAQDALLWGSQVGLSPTVIKLLRLGPDRLKSELDKNASPLSAEDLKLAEDAAIAMTELSQAFKDLTRSVGTSVAPTVITLNKILKPFLEWLTKHSTGIAAALGVVAVALTGLAAVAFAPFILLGGKALLIIAAISAAAFLLADNWKTISNALDGTFDQWEDIFKAFKEGGFFAGVAEYFEKVAQGIGALYDKIFGDDAEKTIKETVETDEGVRAADTVSKRRIETEDDGFFGDLFDFDFSMDDVLDPIKTFFAQMEDIFSNLMTFFDEIMARVKEIKVPSLLMEGSKEDFRAGASGAVTMIEHAAKTITEEKIRTDAFKKTEQFVAAEARQNAAEAFIDSPMSSARVINMAAERSKRQSVVPVDITARRPRVTSSTTKNESNISQSSNKFTRTINEKNTEKTTDLTINTKTAPTDMATAADVAETASMVPTDVATAADVAETASMVPTDVATIADVAETASMVPTDVATAADVAETASMAPTSEAQAVWTMPPAVPDDVRSAINMIDIPAALRVGTANVEATTMQAPSAPTPETVINEMKNACRIINEANIVSDRVINQTVPAAAPSAAVRPSTSVSIGKIEISVGHGDAESIAQELGAKLESTLNTVAENWADNQKI